MLSLLSKVKVKSTPSLRPKIWSLTKKKRKSSRPPERRPTGRPHARANFLRCYFVVNRLALSSTLILSPKIGIFIVQIVYRPKNTLNFCQNLSYAILYQGNKRYQIHKPTLVKPMKQKYRKAEYVKNRVCFVNVLSSLHENVVFSVCARMDNAAYVIFIM